MTLLAPALLSGVLAGCGNNLSEINAANARAEAAAARAESAADAAEIAAADAFNACYQANWNILAVTHSTERLSDYIDRATLGDIVPERDPKKAIYRGDEDHADAVMKCHPELGRLPHVSFITVGQDGSGAKNKNGRLVTVILVTIDDTNPKNGSAILAKAKAVAPGHIEDVPVVVIGTSDWHFELTPGVFPMSASQDQR